LARLVGVDIPNHKRVDIALTAIYGLGYYAARKILKECNVSFCKKVSDLTPSEISLLRRLIDDGYTVEGDLRREISLNIKRLVDLGNYRGLRHRKGLPVRGQRTKTNARTQKGPRKTIAGKKKASK